MSNRERGGDSKFWRELPADRTRFVGGGGAWSNGPGKLEFSIGFHSGLWGAASNSLVGDQPIWVRVPQIDGSDSCCREGLLKGTCGLATGLR